MIARETEIYENEDKRAYKEEIGLVECCKMVSMVKSYYLTFGYPKEDKAELGKIISDKLGIHLKIMSRGTLGYRFGTIAETLSIIENYSEEDDWWQEETFQNYPVLVRVSFTQGKNVDRKQRATKVREILKSVDDLVEIRFEEVES